MRWIHGAAVGEPG